MSGIFRNRFDVKDSKDILVYLFLRKPEHNNEMLSKGIMVEEKRYSLDTTISELRKHFQNNYTFRSDALYAITTSIKRPNGSFERIEILDRNPDGSAVTLNDFMFVGKRYMHLYFHIESRVSFDGVNSEDTVSVRHVLDYYRDPPYSFHFEPEIVKTRSFVEYYPRNTTVFNVCKAISQNRCISKGLYLREVFIPVRRPFYHKVVIHAHNVESRSLTMEDILQLAGANNNNEIEFIFKIDSKVHHPTIIVDDIPSDTFPNLLRLFMVLCLFVVVAIVAYVFVFYFFSGQP